MAASLLSSTRSNDDNNQMDVKKNPNGMSQDSIAKDGGKSGMGMGIDTHLLKGSAMNTSYNHHHHLLSSEDREHALQSLIDRACAELSADLVSVFAYNDATKHLECTFSKDIKGFSIPITKGIVGSAFRMGHVINVTETARDTRHHPEGMCCDVHLHCVCPFNLIDTVQSARFNLY